uniref:NOT2_3_5 domain-containing protein n=2 Tax=Ascaris TaxID=6251 RepID=A0A0M3IFI0_ASCLU
MDGVGKKRFDSNIPAANPSQDLLTPPGNASIDGDFANQARGGSASNINYRNQNEEFPALPGKSNIIITNEHLSLGNKDTHTPIQLRSAINPVTDMDRGLQLEPNGQANQALMGPLNDQFGLLGLLAYVRGAREDPMNVSLAVGEDLTAFGLGVQNEERDVCSTFGGPWATRPCRAQDVDAQVPLEYLTKEAVGNRLPNIKLSKMAEDMLFYVFYNFPGEVYQVAVAHELYDRGWRYHMILRLWLARQQQNDLKEKTASYEIGSYNVFDPVEWRVVIKEMKLEYKELEGRPKPPQSLLALGKQREQADMEGVSSNCL